jgi:chromosome partitioning protein
MKAKIIAVSGQKGGIGKTTTSINLAACISMRATPVLVIDLDPQGSSTDWVEMMKANDKQLFDYVKTEYKDFDQVVSNAMDKYKYIIFDCPPRLEMFVGKVIYNADMVLTSCGVGAVQSWALDDFNLALKQAGVPNYIFMSNVNISWKRLIDQTSKHIAEAGYEKLNTIYSRACVAEAAGLGKCTIHMDDEKATQEIETLTTQVMEILDGL